MAAGPQMLSNSTTGAAVSQSEPINSPDPDGFVQVPSIKTIPPLWQQDLQRAIRDLQTLAERLHLSRSDLSPEAAATFPLLVPESYFQRIEPGNPHDPLLRQVLPTNLELNTAVGFTTDPVGDLQARSAAGLLHKYPGRALLITTGLCAVHCRYCFRREYPYTDEPRSFAEWQPALEALRNDTSIHEIILSGGDPLMLSDSKLKHLINLLADIPHLRRLRLHTRLPIVLPSRVTTELLEILTETRLQAFCIVHANHARELTDDCATAVQRLVRSGLPVLNQAVLLRGVNDSVESLQDLCETCINLGVIPYYLHQLDRVHGAAHFEVAVEDGQHLISALRERLPGYAVPRYVQEIPGDLSKTPL